MTKQEIRQMVNELGVEVKSIRKYGSTYKVKIDWTDYLKVKPLMMKHKELDFTFQRL